MGSCLVTGPATDDELDDELDNEFDNGWDMHATLMDGRWVDRSPRRPEVEPRARREAALLPWLAPCLPLAVPVPRIVSEDPLVLRHELIVGGACPGSSAAHGAALGRFLVALHGVDPDAAVRHGARGATRSHEEARAIRDRMIIDVVPLLPSGLRRAGSALLDRMATPPTDPRVAHGDLGMDHIRVVGDRVSGVIDWGDSGVGDPAIDLAATVYGAGPAFSAAVVAAYRPSEALLARALDFHLLGPWHEVLFGLDTDQDALVASGLEGTVRRLEWG